MNAVRTFALAISLVIALPCPGMAFPGQPPKDAVQPALEFGFKVDRTEFKPGVIYGFGGWDPLHPGEQAQFQYAMSVGADGLVKSDWLSYRVGRGLTLDRADARWRQFIREFYPAAVAREVLDGQPVAAITAHTRQLGAHQRHRILITPGQAFVYEAHVTEPFADEALTVRPQDSQLEYELRVYPRAELQQRIQRLGDYNLQLPVPTSIGSSITDLPAMAPQERQARLKVLPSTVAAQSPGASFEGIGIRLGGHVDGLVIMDVLAGGPAARAGLKAGDVITAIDGVDIKDFHIAEGVQAIRGPAGSPVVLTIAGAGGPARVIKVVRGKVSDW